MAVEIMGLCVNIDASRVCRSLHLTHPTGTDKRMELVVHCRDDRWRCAERAMLNAPRTVHTVIQLVALR